MITAKTTLTVLADGKAVNVPIFVQPNSNHPCLLGTNVLPYLGISVRRANGQPLTLKQPSGSELTSQVRLVEASVVPGRRVKFLEAKLDFPFKKGDSLLFEPDVTILGSHRLSSPDAVMMLQADDCVLVPVENHKPLCTLIDKGTSLGQVTPQSGLI